MATETAMATETDMPTEAFAQETSALVLFSGGLDSTVALAMAVRKFDRVLAVLFDYGQQCRIELDRAREIADYLEVELLEVELDMAQWGGSRLFGETSAGIVKKTAYVPARNLILVSIAAGIAEARELDVLWVGTNASEVNFADQSPAFFTAVQETFDRGLRRSRDGYPLRVGTPLAALTKDIVVPAGLNLDAPLHLSWSCYNNGPEPCGLCGACMQRTQAFEAAGVADPAIALPLVTKRASPDPSQTLYLLGTRYSGSTLLSLLLDAHPDVFAAGELANLVIDVEQRVPCTCGVPVHLCGFWAKVLAAGATTTPPVDASTDPAESPMQEGAAAWDLLDRVAETAKTRVVLDSSKNPARLHAMRNAEPGRRIRALHLVRDGRAYLASMRKHESEESTAAAAAAAAASWITTTGQCSALTTELGEDALTVRYEDLCQNPEAERQRILTWLGLDAGDTIAWDAVKSHHLHGNLNRFNREPVVLDEQWKTTVGATDLQTFTSAARETLLSFGYKTL